MCKLCDEGRPQAHHEPADATPVRDDGAAWNPRRGFLKSGAAAAGGMALFAGAAQARGDRDERDDRAPEDSGRHGRRAEQAQDQAQANRPAHGRPFAIISTPSAANHAGQVRTAAGSFAAVRPRAACFTTG